LAEKKGIRINALAKELGVESKAILQKLKDEGLGDVAPNHMSVIQLGLAESVREWFAHAVGEMGGGGTAVETAAPVDVAVAKPKTARSRKKKEADAPATTDDAVGGGATTATAEAPAAAPAPDEPEADKPARPVRKPPTKVAEAPVTTPIVSEPVVRETPQVVTPAPVTTQAPEIVAPPAPPIAPAIPTATPPTAPKIAAEAPAPTTQQTPPAGPAAAPTSAPPTAPTKPLKSGVPHDLTRPPQVRETITLANRPGLPPPERKPVTPAPKLLVPKPAIIAGPTIVREEAPEHVPVPRARRPVGEGTGGPSSTSIPTMRPGGGVGRGVKVADDDEAEKKKAARTLSNRRRGVDGRRGEAMEKLKEFTEQDLIDRQIRLNTAAASRASFDSHLKKTQSRGTHQVALPVGKRGEPVGIEDPITVKSLSAATGVKTSDIQKKLMMQGLNAAINQTLDAETATAIALEFGIDLHVIEQETLEEILFKEMEASRDIDPAKQVRRPAVVTILGHVDHGKTSLLDKIRTANVAAGESGGITQHTAAWVVEVEGGDGTKKKVTFIDTPGHQAFTSMRARGANMTDVVVLVVAAVEGVMPQTVESINHARAAGVPIVVALNKIDRPDANPDMVLGQLAQQQLNPVEWGGDTEVIRTSAVTGQGIKELIEILDYQAELLDLKADPTAPARGTVIESRVDPGLGSVATVLIQDGTLHTGDVGLSGPGYGRIRSLINDRGEQIAEAGPATPVIVSGLSVLPNAGDKFYVLEDNERARAIAEERETMTRQNQLSQASKVTLDNLFATMKAGDIKTINLIIKGDVQGSVETLAKTVTDQNTDEVRIRVIHSAVGGITESDVELADASDAVIIGFHVVPDESARAMAEQRHVEIRLYRVIYEIFDDLKKALSGLLEPEVREKLHGHVEIRQVFKVSKIGNIAGCFVTDGHIQRGSKMRLIRDGRIITEDLAIETLRRLKDDVKEVKAGLECGIKLAGYDDIKIGDRLEAYVRETIQRTL
jgi:translation initiation factor IF-2